jgi:transposase
MVSENNQGGRPTNEEIDIRRGRVKEMLLQGATYREMEQALGVSSATIYSDVSYWQEYFKKLAQDNPEIAKIGRAHV